MALHNTVICLTGKLSAVRKDILADIRDNGGHAVNTVTVRCTHLIATEYEVAKPTKKVSDARGAIFAFFTHPANPR
jgi:NAD-dependent DNA ligase